MHETLPEILNALHTLLVLLGVYAGLPALYLALRNRSRGVSFSAISLASALLMASQAGFSILLLNSPYFQPAAYIWLLLPGTVLAGECARWIFPRTGKSDPWLAGILLLAVVVRVIPAVENAALGQSDAYSHLQFLRDVVTTGSPRHPFYPPGHARVTAVAAWLAGISPHVLARHGGAFYGLGLVAGVYTLTRRMTSPVAARAAALLAAAFPGVSPLLRTGVGLFANQLGLLWIPFFLCLMLENRPSDRVPRWLAGGILTLGLAVTVPMMLVDFAPVALLWGWFRFSPRIRWAWILLPPLLGAGAALALLTRLPPESREAVAGMLTLSPPGTSGVLAIFLHLVADFLFPSANAHPLVLRAPVFLVALLALATVRTCNARAPRWTLVLLFCGVSGLQAATAVLQFSAYQRAGWFFLISMCVLGGGLFALARKRLPLARLGDTALLGVCLLSLVHPPRHRPHLSGNEEALARRLLDIRTRHANCTPGDCWHGEAPLHLHTRVYTRFHGAQGDPVPAFLEDIPCVRLHRHLPGEPVPDPAPGRHLFILDSRVPAPTGDIHFDQEVAWLTEAAQGMREALEALRKGEGRWTGVTETNGLEVHSVIVVEAGD